MRVSLPDVAFEEQTRKSGNSLQGRAAGSLLYLDNVGTARQRERQMRRLRSPAKPQR